MSTLLYFSMEPEHAMALLLAALAALMVPMCCVYLPRIFPLRSSSSQCKTAFGHTHTHEHSYMVASPTSLRVQKLLNSAHSQLKGMCFLANIPVDKVDTMALVADKLPAGSLARPATALLRSPREKPWLRLQSMTFYQWCG
jgi:hypothetical protein